MKFCRECGHALKDDVDYCKHCGTAIHKQALKADKDLMKPKQRQSTGNSGSSSRPPMSKKSKLLLYTGIAIIILLIAGYVTGSKIYSEERAVSHFKEALQDQDKDALADLLYSDDSSLKIDKTGIDGFLNYLKKHPSYQQELLASLEKQAKAKESNDEDVDSVVKLVKHGKKLFMFNHYRFAIPSYYFTIHTNNADTDLYLGKEKIATSDKDDYSEEVGPFMPGSYQVKAKLKNNYTTLNDEKEIDLFEGNQKGERVDMSLEGSYVTVESDHLKGTLVVNGKETDLHLEDNPELGPIPTDGSVKLQIKTNFPWGKELSDEMAVKDQNLYLDKYPVSEDLQKSLMKAVNHFQKDYYKAYTASDSGKFKNISSDYADDLSSKLKDMKHNKTKYKGKLLKMVYDLDSFSVKKQDDYHAKLEAEVTDETDRYSKHDNPQLSKDERYITFKLVYDKSNKQWLVDNQVESWSVTNMDNTKEFIMDKGQEKEVSDRDNKGDFKDDKEAFSKLISGYLDGLTDAINSDDYSLVAPFLANGSNLAVAQEKLVKHLHKEGTTEKVKGHKIKDITNHDSKGESQIDVDETIEINYKSGKSETKDYKWTYTAKKMDDGTYQLSDIKSR